MFIGVKTKWTRAVEKLVRKQKALKEEQTLASKNSDQASAVEKPAAADGLPSRRDHPTARTKFNRIWDDPRPEADKPIGPPATPKSE